MVRLLHAYFPTRTLLLALADALVVVLALCVAIWLALQGEASAAITPAMLWKVAGVCCVVTLCIYYFDLYESRVVANQREMAGRLLQVLGTAGVVLAVVYVAYPQARLSEQVIFSGIVLAGVTLVLCRKLFFVLSGSPRLTERTVLVGCGPLAASLVDEINNRPELGLQVLGYLGEGTARADGSGLRWLGGLERLLEMSEQERVERVIVTLHERRGHLPLETLLQLKGRGIKVEDGSDFYEMAAGKVPLESLHPSWLVFSRGFRVSRIALLYKRAFAFTLSALCLLLSLPLMLLIALAIRLDSPGPAIFRQKRVGQSGALFTLYKFRSMRMNADAGGVPRPVGENDDRLTRVGRWLRASRLDELPQLYNILLGDMYFVGPRPFVPEQEAEMVEKIPFYRYRWAIKPGATGWAQIHRAYCATVEDNAEKLAYDLFYIKNMSLGLDLLILFQTVKILLLGRGAR